MTTYLVCTRKNYKNMLTGIPEKRCHKVAPDGKHTACGRVDIEAGHWGWKVKKYSPVPGEICNYCLRLK